MHTVLECSRNSYECFLCLLCSSTFCLCIFLLWSNILSQKLYFLYMDLLHLSQQASYSTLVRDYEGDMLVDLEGDMQSALFLMQWLLHPFAAVETSKIMHALRLHKWLKSFGDSCLHSNLSQNLHKCMDKYMQWGINKHIRILFAELSGKQAYAFRGVAMPVHFYRILHWLTHVEPWQACAAAWLDVLFGSRQKLEYLWNELGGISERKVDFKNHVCIWVSR